MGIKGVPPEDGKQDSMTGRSKQRLSPFTLESHGLPREVLLGNYSVLSSGEGRLVQPED